MGNEGMNDSIRLLEALLFASGEPLDEDTIKQRLPQEDDLQGLLSELSQKYADRGVNLVHVGGKWTFRTAPDVAPKLKIEKSVPRRLSRAAIETLAVIAYHQPVTRAEIEEIRGVGQSRGTLDMLLEAGWIKPGRRRRSPGRPLTWVTTDAFLEHFSLPGLDALPGVDELKAAGLLDTRPAIGILRERGDLSPLGEGADIEEADQEDSFDESDLQSTLIESDDK